MSVGRSLRRILRCAAPCVVALLISCASEAGPFGDGGIVIPPIYIHGATSTPSKLIEQADGKLLVVGTAAGPVNWTMFAARFTSVGTLDDSYGAAGIAFVPIPSFATSLSAQDATLDSQGNVLISGALDDRSYFGSTVVARLTPSGSPDATFGSEGVRQIVLANPDTGSRASSIAIDSLGRIVVLVSSENPNTVPPIIVVRLNSDGSFDTTFNGTGIFRFGAYPEQAGSVAVDRANEIFISGMDIFAPNAPVFVAKVTAAGQLDSSFNGSGLVYLPLGADNARFPVAIDPDNKVLVASEHFSTALTRPVFQVARLTPSGAADASFGVAGIASLELDGLISAELLTSMALDSLGRIVVAAHGTNPQTNGDGLFAARFLETGDVDTTFNGSGIQSVPITPYTGWAIATLAIGAEDRVVLAGTQFSASSGSMDVLVGRLTSTGALDTTFNATGVVAQSCGVKQLTVTSLALQRDGRLLLGGYTGDSGSAPDDKMIVARLDASGALDPTFNGAGFKAIVDAPSIERNRKSLVSIDGSDNIVFGGANQAGDFVVARMTPAGAPDLTFNGSGSNAISGFVAGWSVVSGLTIDAKGNIVLAGIGDATPPAFGLFGAMRFTSSGTLDATFGGGGGIARIPLAAINELVGVSVDSAGRILLGGTTWDDALSQPNGMVVRLTDAGMLDTSFGGNGGVAGVLVVPPPTGSYSVESTAFAVDASNRILLIGNDRGLPLVTRLTPAGELDADFNGSGRFSYNLLGPWFVNGVAIDSAGRILLAGDVADVDPTGEMHVLRLLSTGNLDPAFNGAGALDVTAIPGPHLNRANALVVEGAGGIYVGGSVDRAAAIVKLFDSAPVELAFVAINEGAPLTPYQPFDVVVQAQDDIGNAQPVSNATTIQISLANGSGTLIGTPACVIPVGSTSCRVAGLMYSKAESYVILAAVATAGEVLRAAQSAPFSVYMAQSTTVLSADINPSAQGQTVTWTATVTGSSPTGSVKFYDGYGLCSGDAALTGAGNVKTATCSSAGLPVGKTQISALYSGDANNFNSGSVLSQVVNSVPNTNVALASTGGRTIASSVFSPLYPVSAINDGDRAGRNFGNGGVWRDATPGVFPDWVQINFSGAQTIERVIVYSVQDDKLNPIEPTDTLTFSRQGITEFEAQALVGSQWVSLESVIGNNLVKRTVKFPPMTATAIRIIINAAKGGKYSALTEVEAWTPAPSTPPSPVTLVSSANPARTGRNVVFTSAISGNNPTGTVAFRSSGATINGCGSVALSGSGSSKTAACTTSFPSAGTYSIGASYSGDANNPAASSAPLSEVVKKR